MLTGQQITERHDDVLRLAGRQRQHFIVPQVLILMSLGIKTIGHQIRGIARRRIIRHACREGDSPPVVRQLIRRLAPGQFPGRPLHDRYRLREGDRDIIVRDADKALARDREVQIGTLHTPLARSQRQACQPHIIRLIEDGGIRGQPSHHLVGVGYGILAIVNELEVSSNASLQVCLPGERQAFEFHPEAVDIQGVGFYGLRLLGRMHKEGSLIAEEADNETVIGVVCRLEGTQPVEVIPTIITAVVAPVNVVETSGIHSINIEGVTAYIHIMSCIDNRSSLLQLMTKNRVPMGGGIENAVCIFHHTISEGPLQGFDSPIDICARGI